MCCQSGSSRAEMRAIALATWLAGKDVVIVSGLYKTGTSLAVDLCERAGFADPSRETNPTERGYGISLRRYLTRECRVLRRLNETLLAQRAGLSAMTGFDGSRRQSGTWPPASIRRLEGYLLSWRAAVVLKDPRFVFTLQRWIAAASHLQMRAGVIFTHRQDDQLRKAWESAPVTRELLARGKFTAYAAGYNEQLAWCLDMNVPQIVLSLHELRRIDSVWVKWRIAPKTPGRGEPSARGQR